MPDDELLAIGEAAKRLKISRMDLRRLLQDKKLPAIRTERRQWRISATALKEFMDRSGAAKGGVMAANDPITITRLPDGRFGVSQDDGTSQAFSTEEELRVHLTNRFGHSIAEDLIRRVKGGVNDR